MSRGMGKVQQLCMEVLAEQSKEIDSIAIAAEALQKDEITESEHVSFRRALRQLERAGKIVDLGRSFRDRRRHWALPEIAKRYFHDEEKFFGKEKVMRDKAKANFTTERFPGYA